MPERHLYSDTLPNAEGDEWIVTFNVKGIVVDVELPSELVKWTMNRRAELGWSWMPLGPIPEITRPRPEPKFQRGDRVLLPDGGEPVVVSQVYWIDENPYVGGTDNMWHYDGYDRTYWSASEDALLPAPTTPAFSVGDVVRNAFDLGADAPLGRVANDQPDSVDMPGVVNVTWPTGHTTSTAATNLTLVTCPDGWREMVELSYRDVYNAAVHVAYPGGAVATFADRNNLATIKQNGLWWKPCEVPAHPFTEGWPKP